MPIVMMDLNSPLVCTPGINSAGPLSSACTHYACQEMAAARHDLSTIAINSDKGTGDKTYYSGKAASHIDFFFVPKGAIDAVCQVQAMWPLVCKLQSIPDGSFVTMCRC